MRLRVWMSVGLLIVVPAMVFGALTLVGAFFLIAVQYTGRGAQYTDRTGFQLLVLALPVLVGLLVTAVGLRRLRSPDPAAGLEIEPEDEPELWAEIDDLSAALGEEPPDRLVLDARVNASVTEATGDRELIIGLPLLVGLDRAELRAVLAHELAHFAHGHTRGSGFVLRTQYFLHSAADRLDGGLLRRLLTLYLGLYGRVSSSVRREHERQADLWAARLAGPDAAISALGRLPVLDVAWDQVLDRYGRTMTRNGPRGSLSEALIEVLQDSQAELEDAVRRRRPSQDDSHPPTEQRMATLRRLPDPRPGELPRLENPYEPAWSWLLSPDRRLAEVERAEVLPGPEPKISDWGTVLTPALLDEADEKAGRLMSALRQVDPQAPPTLDSLLRELASGYGLDLVDPGAGATAVLTDRLTATIVSVLADQRRILAGPDFGPDGPYRTLFVAPNGRSYDWPFAEVIAGAVEDPRSVDALAEALMSAEVDLRAPVRL
jgi:Zn-dependent protease with chaperone function